MFIVDSWQDIVDAHVEAGRPLDEESIDQLKCIAADPRAKGCQWAAFIAKCRICSHTELVIVPFVGDADLDNLECTYCDNDSMMERELEEWQM